MVWDEIIKVAAANGIWALLFVGLLVYELQDSRKREVKYQQTIDSLVLSVKAVEEIKDDVKLIKASNESPIIYRKARESKSTLI